MLNTVVIKEKSSCYLHLQRHNKLIVEVKAIGAPPRFAMLSPCPFEQSILLLIIINVSNAHPFVLSPLQRIDGIIKTHVPTLMSHQVSKFEGESRSRTPKSIMVSYPDK